MPTKMKAGKVLWKAGQRAHLEQALRGREQRWGYSNLPGWQRKATGGRKKEWTAQEAVSMAVLAFIF